jgi:hypothetical protein
MAVVASVRTVLQQPPVHLDTDIVSRISRFDDRAGRDETVSAAVEAERAAPAEPSNQQAADSTGSVAVTVDPAGVVDGVEVAGDWPDRVAPEQFPAAVYEAYVGAVLQAQRAAAIRQLAGTSTSTRMPATATARDHPDRVGAARPGPARTTDNRTTLVSRNGLLTVTVAAATWSGRRTVVAITGNPRRIAVASAGQLQLDAARVLADATRPTDR